MRAILNRNTRRTGIDRHLQIMRGIADHHGAPQVLPQLAGQLLQHGRMRLREGFVGTAGGVEHRQQFSLVQGAIQPDPALAGGDRQEISLLRQIRQHFTYAVKQGEVLVLRQIVIAITLYHSRILARLQARHRQLHRFRQTKPDHMRSCLVVRNCQPQIPGRRLNTLHDDGRTVHQGAIPIKYDQVKFFSCHIA